MLNCRLQGDDHGSFDTLRTISPTRLRKPLMKRVSQSLALLWLALWPSTIFAFQADPKPADTSLGATPPEGAVVLFSGKNLDGWVKLDGKAPAVWPVHEGIFTVGGGNIMTQKHFGDFELHLEFNVPYMPTKRGQGRGNSGVYLTGNHEVQILDSYKLKLQSNDCGAIYQQIIPSVNACKPPLQWQTYDITFHKAKVEQGKVVKKARLTVIHNGIKTIDNAEISITPGGIEVADGHDGPLMLQDHGNPVEYRNIWIKPLD
jgi:Domain of Unknown Function (DUF1080)